MSIALRRSDATIVSVALNSGEDRPVLKILREETSTLVVMVQVVNEERKEQWKREHEPIEKGEEYESDNTPLF